MLFDCVNGECELIFGRVWLAFCATLVVGVFVVCAAGGADVNAGPAGGGDKGEPNGVGGALEFRIAPQDISTPGRPSLLTAEEIAECRKDLAENGPSASLKREDSFVWIKITPGVELSRDLITEEHEGGEYLLVCNGRYSAMSSGVDWWLQSVMRGAGDNMGRPCVQFQLDSVGADRFYNLTSSNTGEALAIIVEGKVFSAPRIASAVHSHGVIAGDFTEAQIEAMMTALEKDVRAVSIPAAPPTLRVSRTYLIAILILVLAISIGAFVVYR